MNTTDLGLVFGLDPYSIKGKMLRNKHTGLYNKVVHVMPGLGTGKPTILFAPGTSHDIWTLEAIEAHYYPPNAALDS